MSTPPFGTQPPMTTIIDRRKNLKGKNDSNRYRFLRRYHEVISEAVRREVNSRSIKTATSDGVTIKVKRERLSEPSFRTDPETGTRQGVNVGNKKYKQGDLVLRPSSNNTMGRGGSGDEESTDDFYFTISSDEFQKYFFEDLELPNMVNTSLDTEEIVKYVRSGYATVGNPANLDLVRSVRNSLTREIAFDDDDESNFELILKLQTEYDFLMSVIDRSNEQQQRINQISDELEQLLTNNLDDSSTTFSMDDMDLQYRAFSKQVQPNSKAVMFCILDVSGSMGQNEKDLAKRFFILLYLFLQREYGKIEVRFIRHHSIAEEVNEEQFFYERVSGGTVVSTAMVEINRIIQSDYNDGTWNIYGAQASDGDNDPSDNVVLNELLTTSVLPKMQYYAYIEITSSLWGSSSKTPDSDLWTMYNNMTNHIPWLATAHVAEAIDIYPVFSRLFKKV